MTFPADDFGEGVGLRKPAYGAPCNGCGICCIAVQCPVSTAIFGKADRCPALEASGFGFRCGLMRDVTDYVDTSAWAGTTLTEAMALLIGAGIGCDGDDGTESDEAVNVGRRAVYARGYRALEEASPDARAIVQFIRHGDPL